MSVKDRRRRSKNLSRSTEIRKVKTTFRIYTEGLATEPEYIDILKRLPKFNEAASVEIKVEESGATPKHLVDSACEAKRLSNLEVDHYWCIFDVESPRPHPHLAEAKEKARANNVQLAISNPCFEIWLILHHQYFAKYISTDEAIRKRKEIDSSDLKHLNPDLYRPLIEQAIKNAVRLRQKHAKDGTLFPEDNPSSSFDCFVSQLVDVAKSNTKAPNDGD